MADLRIYFSYSHRDREWRERLMAHLAPLRRTVEMVFWDDQQISPGDSWSVEIDKAINQADIAVLLISADFLASEFIANNEIPKILYRQKQQGTVILPVIVRPCAWQTVSWLAQIQVLPRDGRPLSAHENVDEALFEVGKRIIEISEIVSSQKSSVAGAKKTSEELKAPAPPPTNSARKTSTKKAATKPAPPPSDSPSTSSARTNGHIFICHNSGDGDFAELLKLKLEKAGFDAWIDVDRLRVGVDWRLEIDEALRGAAAVIVVMTPGAKLSEYVTYEWAYATGAGVKVIPLMVNATQLHPRLESLQYLDFSNRRARPWDTLIEEITQASAMLKKSLKK